MDQHRANAVIQKRLTDIGGMGHCRAEDDGLATVGLLPPVPYHFLIDRRRVEDRCYCRHVKIGRSLADRFQLVLLAEIDDEGARPHQMPGGDQFTQGDLIGHIGKHRPQSRAIAAIRGRRNAENADIRIAIANGIDDAPVGRRGSMVTLIDHQ